MSIISVFSSIAVLRKNFLIFPQNFKFKFLHTSLKIIPAIVEKSLPSSFNPDRLIGIHEA